MTAAVLFVAVTVASAMPAAAPRDRTAVSTRPNIILMMADDLGWGDPSYNGGWISTPTLDNMVSSGLRFDRFYSASAVCSPTRASCLTGRNPLRVGVPGANTGHLGRDETPLSEVLDNAGYTCGHFGKWHLGTLTTLRNDSNRGSPGAATHYSAPWHHQYDICFATEAKVPTYHPMRKTGSNANPEPVNFADSNFYGTHYWTPPLDPGTWTNTTGEGQAVAVTNNLSGDDSTVVMDRAIPFIRSAVASNRPFFAVVWFHTPHKPVVDPELTTAVDGAAAYTDAIQDMDTQIGRLRAELDALGVRTNTMLWFCSDNGPENGVGQPGGLRARKRSLHEGGVRVPGILEWPAVVAAARTTDYPCVTSDYYPTILDALELTVTNQKPIDGISLMPLVTNASFNLPRGNPIGFRINDDRSWVTQRHKLISKDGGSTYELYDLLADTNETTNIIASEPRVAARLQLELETWIAAISADTEYVPPPPASGWSSVAVSSETVTTTNAQVHAWLGVPSGTNTTVSLEWDRAGAPADDWSFINGTLPDSTGGLVTAWLSGLTADTEYRFRFKAANDVDVNDTSTPVRVTTDLSATQIPAVTSITSNGTDITLAWADRDDNGTGFVVEYSQEGAAVTGHQEVSSTNWTHRTGTPHARFFYRVGAINAQFGGSFSGYSGWTNQVTGDALLSTGTTTVLTAPTFETVDAHGDIPGDDDNNLDKFDTGGSFGAEFTTTLYVRGNSGNLDRRVKAYAAFDLTPLTGGAVNGATLRFRGFSLNDNGAANDTTLQVSRLTENWATATDPFKPAVTNAFTGPSVMTQGAPTTGADFSVDVTSIVSNWVAGAANHGFFLRLDDLSVNNGLGIKIAGAGAIELEVRQAGTVDPSDTDGDGILDTWELQHWGSLTNASNVTDSDTDPHSDLQEYIADTDPTNAASFFDIKRIEADGNVRITFDSSTGRLYRAQFADELPGTTVWSNMPGVARRLGAGKNDVLVDTNAAPVRNYRIEVSLP
jgi:arylsulfatase A-like enzyme